MSRQLAIFGGALAALLLISPLHGQETGPPVEPPGEVLDYRSDRNDRMTVPVSIGGKGPFAFVVDTGAERTVISRELARDLQLQPGQPARMHSITETSRVSTVLIPRLSVGARSIEGIHAPALDSRNLGAVGMLGVDSLQSQRVSFDFIKREMSVAPSRRTEVRWPKDTVVVTARSRFGHLVLVDASIDGQRVYAVVDTGSQVTIGNDALRRRLERRRKLGLVKPIMLLSVTGAERTADYAVANRITLGDAEILNMPIAFSQVHIFEKLNLADRPAILLGMDTLQLFDRVSVDFANRRVRLLRPGRSEAATGIGLAARRAAHARTRS